MSIRNSSILIFKRLIYVPVLCTSFLRGLPAASGAVYQQTRFSKRIGIGNNIAFPNYFAALIVIKVYGIDTAVYAITTSGNLNAFGTRAKLSGTTNLDNYFVRENGYIKFASGYDGQMTIIAQENIVT